MEAFRYERPGSLDAACTLLADGGARAFVLAGGTDLLVALKTGALDRDALVVDVKAIPELTGVTPESDGFRIGAATPAIEVTENAELAAAWPGVVEATGLIGSTQIQGRASLGGNLCNASPAADTVPALIAAGARCRIVSPAGERIVPVEEVVRGPGETALGAGELVVEFLLGRPAAREADAYLRMIPRSEMDIAVAGAGVRIALDPDGRCRDARVSVGAVAPTALDVVPAAEALVGSSVDAPALDAMVEAVRAACRPIDDRRGTAAYRVRVAGVLARRAAAIALERANARS